MGMAASQARFLGLTARKSNVEYQVQQINQQRTSLANESAGLYNQMMELSVPTPPSVNSFYETNYVLDGSGNGYEKEDYKIGNMTKTYNQQGEYLVSLITKVDETKIKTETYERSNSVTKEEDGVTTSTISLRKKDSGAYQTLTYDSSASAYTSEGSISVVANQIYPIDSQQTAKPDGYDECIDTADGKDVAYFYQDSSGKNHFLTQAQLDSLLNNEEGTQDDYFSFMTTYTYSKEMTTQVKAFLEESDNGRLTTITVEDDDSYPESLRGMTFSLSAVQEYNEKGYEQAYNDYEYEKALYEKAMSDINAQTEEIQVKDQSLELKIKQLDTEQNAIQTEMDSVQKVIEDNVEKTFNIFG